MILKTHIAFGVLLFLLVDFYYELENKLLVFVLFMLFSLLPDIDRHTSFLGNRLKPISYIFELILRHRGIIHSLWIVLVLYLILSYYSLEIALIGYIGHLMLDMLNPKGVKFLWPFLRIRGSFKSGGIVDSSLFLVMVLIVVIILFL